MSSVFRKMLCILVFALLIVSLTAVFAGAEAAPGDTANEASEAAESSSAKSSIAKEFTRRTDENLPEEGTMGERLEQGLQITVLGMCIVFSVLIILMIVLYLSKLIFAKKSNDKAPAANAAPAVSTAAANDAEELTAAVVSAAIAAERGDSEANLNIISINKID